MLVYDITNEKSFDNIKNWIRNIEEVTTAHLQYSESFSDLSELITNRPLAARVSRRGKDDPWEQMRRQWQAAGVQRQRREGGNVHWA